MKYLLAFLGIISFQLSNAQGLLPNGYDTSKRVHDLQLEGSAFIGSTGIRNEIMDRFIFGGEITESMKDRSLSSKATSYRMGAGTHVELTYRNEQAALFGNDKWGYLIKAGADYLGAIRTNKSIFGMLLKGNASYLGESISLNGTQFNFIGFQKIGFGLIHKKTHANIGLNYYNISDFAQGKISSGYLTNAPNADSISLATKGNFQYSNASFFTKGFGFGMDGALYLQINEEGHSPAILQLKVSNLGFACVSQKVQHADLDIDLHFKGFNFQELLSDQSALRDKDLLLDTIGVQTSTKTSYVMLPALIEIGKIVDQMNSKRLQAFYGVRFYPTLANLPLIYGGAEYRIGKHLHLGAHASYGGFTQFSGGMYLHYEGSKFNAGIGSENIVGMIYQKGFGQSVQCKLNLRL